MGLEKFESLRTSRWRNSVPFAAMKTLSEAPPTVIRGRGWPATPWTFMLGFVSVNVACQVLAS
jgi:hypothetical protein